MRMSHILAVSLLAFPLGGCFGVTLPTAPVPDWAMNSQSQEQYKEQFQEQSGAAPGAPARKQRVVRQREPRALTAAQQSELLTGSTVSAQPATRDLDAKPFAPGWDSREDERDPSLRRTLNICRGC
jgi:hypothetical protein